VKTVNVHEAKSTLSVLLSEVEHGEEVTIARNGTPVAKLVRLTASHRRHPGLFAPMTDAELAEEGWV